MGPRTPAHHPPWGLQSPASSHPREAAVRPLYQAGLQALAAQMGCLCPSRRPLKPQSHLHRTPKTAFTGAERAIPGPSGWALSFPVRYEEQWLCGASVLLLWPQETVGCGGDPTDTERRSNAAEHNGCHDSNGKTRRE